MARDVRFDTGALSLIEHGKLIRTVQEYVKNKIYVEIDEFSCLENKSLRHAVKIGQYVENYVRSLEFERGIGSKFNPRSLSTIAAMEVVKRQYELEKKNGALANYNKGLLEVIKIYEQRLGNKNQPEN